MSYQQENSHLLRGLTAILAASTIAACMLGMGHPLMLLAVFGFYKCVGSFFAGLNNNPRNHL